MSGVQSCALPICILRDLHDAGLRGRMPEFIGKFLTDRAFHVRVGSCLSDAFKQEMGVPQGSILSVTLFILKINSLSDSGIISSNIAKYSTPRFPTWVLKAPQYQFSLSLLGS